MLVFRAVWRFGTRNDQRLDIRPILFCLRRNLPGVAPLPRGVLRGVRNRWNSKGFLRFDRRTSLPFSHDFPAARPTRAPPRAPSKDDIHVTNVQTDPQDHTSRFAVPWTRARAGLGGVGRGNRASWRRILATNRHPGPEPPPQHENRASWRRIIATKPQTGPKPLPQRGK